MKTLRGSEVDFLNGFLEEDVRLTTTLGLIGLCFEVHFLTRCGVCFSFLTTALSSLGGLLFGGDALSYKGILNSLLLCFKECVLRLV